MFFLVVVGAAFYSVFFFVCVCDSVWRVKRDIYRERERRGEGRRREGKKMDAECLVVVTQTWTNGWPWRGTLCSWETRVWRWTTLLFNEWKSLLENTCIFFKYLLIPIYCFFIYLLYYIVLIVRVYYLDSSSDIFFIS